MEIPIKPRDKSTPVTERIPLFTKHWPVGLLVGALSATPAMAHIIPSDFGTYDGSVAAGFTANFAVTSKYGWIDGSDADWGDSHKTASIRFSLTDFADVLLTFTGAQVAAGLPGLNPGFTLEQGLPHLDLNPDHDFSIGSEFLRATDCAATAGCTSTEGAFRALDSWRITSDADPAGTSPSVFTPVGYAYDGSQNYGTGLIAGGDGANDNTVSRLFQHLAPGDYTVFFGGSDYAAQSSALIRNYGVIASLNVTPTAVPAPAPATLLLSGLSLIGATARRRSPKPEPVNPN